MTKQTGGPAFPQNTKIMLPAGQEVHQGFMGGMTLRDYFAAKALQGMLSDHTNQMGEDEDWNGFCQSNAESAYAMADAMLKAREQ